MDIYRVLADGIESDKKKKRWEKGSTVTAKDFPKSVISNWVAIGVLEKVSKNGER